jgi:hypothetical protein
MKLVICIGTKQHFAHWINMRIQQEMDESGAINLKRGHNSSLVTIGETNYVLVRSPDRMRGMRPDGYIFLPEASKLERLDEILEQTKIWDAIAGHSLRVAA